MDFSPTLDQQRWVDHAARFAAEELRPFADDWDARGEFPAECFRKAAGEGLAGLFAPTAVGGQGLDVLTACMVYEALARGCFATTFGLVVHNNVVRALALSGTPAARDRWLGSLVNGELLGSFALTEPDAGSDAAAITTRAEPLNGGFRLNGVKAWVSNGGVADLYNVMARTGTEPGARGVSSFVVERTRPGVSFGPRDRKMAAGALPTCRMHLEDVWVPAENLLGVEGAGLRGALATIDAARAVVAAMATGIAAAALDKAVGYAKERRAFGQPIAAFQGLQIGRASCRERV